MTFDASQFLKLGKYFKILHYPTYSSCLFHFLFFIFHFEISGKYCNEEQQTTYKAYIQNFQYSN